MKNDYLLSKSKAWYWTAVEIIHPQHSGSPTAQTVEAQDYGGSEGCGFEF